jgi:hypothetical protein
MSAETPQVQLVIRVAQNGSIEVSGPLHNKAMCYGLLECARDIVKDHVDKAQRSQIVTARPADPFLMKRPNGAA